MAKKLIALIMLLALPAFAQPLITARQLVPLSNELVRIETKGTVSSNAARAMTVTSSNVLRSSFSEINITQPPYNATGDLRVITIGGMSNLFTITNTVAWLSTDTNKYVTIFRGGPTNSDMVARISSVAGNVATLDRKVSNTVAAAYAHVYSDNTLAFSNFLAACEANGGGAAYVPPGIYNMLGTNWMTASSWSLYRGVPTLRIRTNNISFRGAGMDRSILAFGGMYRNVDGLVMRNMGIAVTRSITNFWFSKLGLWSGRTNANSDYHGYPALTTNGSGWDVGNKGFSLYNEEGGEIFPDQMHFVDSRIWGWGGETFYAGVETAGLLFIDNCIMEESPASLLNVYNVRARNTIFRRAYMGAEFAQNKTSAGSTFFKCVWEDLARGFGASGVKSNATAPVTIDSCTFQRITDYAIFGANGKDYTIMNSVFTTNGADFQATSATGIQPGDEPGWLRLNFHHNTLLNSGGFSLAGWVNDAWITDNRIINTTFPFYYFGFMTNVHFLRNYISGGTSGPRYAGGGLVGNAPLMLDNIWEDGLLNAPQFSQEAPTNSSPMLLPYRGEYVSLYAYSTSGTNVHDVSLSTTNVADGAEVTFRIWLNPNGSAFRFTTASNMYGPKLMLRSYHHEAKYKFHKVVFGSTYGQWQLVSANAAMEGSAIPVSGWYDAGERIKSTIQSNIFFEAVSGGVAPVWTTNANGNQFRVQADGPYLLVGGTWTKLTNQISAQIAAEAAGGGDTTVLSNAVTTRIDALNPYDPARTWIVFAGDSITSGDPVNLVYTYPYWITNSPQWRGLFFATNCAVSGTETLAQMLVFSNTVLPRLPVLATNGTNVIISWDTGSNDFASSTNAAQLIAQHTPFFTFLKSRRYTIVRPNVTHRFRSGGVQSVPDQVFKKELFIFNKWLETATNLIDAVPDFAGVAPDYSDTALYLTDQIHQNTNGQYVFNLEWDTSTRFSRRPKSRDLQRVGQAWDFRNPLDGSQAAAVDYLGRYYQQGDRILDSPLTGGNLQVGGGALPLVTTGTDNTGVGNLALASLTEGYLNTGVGRESLRNTTTGIGNTGVGKSAGQANISGNFNTFLGGSAGVLTRGGVNTLIGYNAGNSLTTGDYNVILGGLRDVPTATTSDYMDINGVFFATGFGGYTGTNVSPNILSGVGIHVPTAKWDVNGTFRSRGIATFNTNIVAATMGTNAPADVVAYMARDSAGNWRDAAIPTGGGGGSTNNAGFSQVSAGQFTTNGNTLGLHPNVTNDLAAAMRAELVAAIATNGLATNYMTYSYLTNPIAMNTLWTNNTGYPVTLGIALHHTNSSSGTTVIYYTNHITGETFIDGYVPVVNVEAHIYKPLVVKVAAGQHISITNVKSGSIPGGSLIDGSIGIVEKINSRAVGDVLEIPQINTPELYATNINLPSATANRFAFIGPDKWLTNAPFFPQGGSPALTNLVANTATTVTNENSAALQINAGVLSLTPGVASNLVNSTIDVPVGNVVSNVTSLKHAIHLPSITVSNLLLSTATNYTEAVGLTNIVLTNIVEEVTGVAVDVTVMVRQTLAVSVPIVWPAFGGQHGYYFHTNGLNDVLSQTVAPPGSNTVIALKIIGTNVYPSVTTWGHP